MHVIVREKLAKSEFIASRTEGYDAAERQWPGIAPNALPRSPRSRSTSSSRRPTARVGSHYNVTRVPVVKKQGISAYVRASSK
jgi:hypothetical protein